MDVARRVALVTGGGYGIGRGIAKRLADEGARVVVDDVDDERVHETVQLIEDAGGTAAYVNADTTREEDVHEMLRFAVDRYGGLDIVVNNGGGSGTPPYYPNVEPERWRAVLDWYLYSYMAVIQEALAVMGERGGAIVNISSMAGVGYSPYGFPEYAAAKAGIIRLTAALGALASRNVRVNCICPNWVATEQVKPLVAAMSPEQRRQQHVPQHLATPEDIGDAVLEFLRDDTMAGRILHHFAHGEQRLVPIETEY